jgi:hypothetical protein
MCYDKVYGWYCALVEIFDDGIADNAAFPGQFLRVPGAALERR